MRKKGVLVATVGILTALLAIAYLSVSLPRGAQTTTSNRSCSLQLLQSIPLKNIVGRLDHLAVDLTQKKLFLAAFANNSLISASLVSGTVIKSIGNLSQPQGVLLVPGSSTVYLSNGGDGSLDAFDSNSLSIIRRISFSSDPDNLRYDSGSKLLYVGYGAGGIAVVNTSSGRIIKTVGLIGHPESFQLEVSGPRIFVNVPAGSYVAVLDRNTSSIVSRWLIPNARGNYAMALDERDHRLFISTREPPQLVVMDTDSGNIITRIVTPQDPDDIYYDVSNGCIYVAEGQGFISIIKQVDSNHYSEAENLPTSRGARTALLVPELSRLYLAAPSTNTTQAEIRVYEVSSA